jgi:hypothetical protein
VLLRLGPHAPDVSNIEAAAKARRVPLETIALNNTEVIDLYEHRFVLVRPDGHMAWRQTSYRPETYQPPAIKRLIDILKGATKEMFK